MVVRAVVWYVSYIGLGLRFDSELGVWGLLWVSVFQPQFPDLIVYTQ